jgi:hypothetical protein
MLLMVSTLLALMYTGVCLMKVYLNRENLGNMTGMTVAMILGMISSLTVGLIVGIVFTNDLTLSTIIAVSFGIIVGVMAGKPISLIVMLEGIGAGVMGGMMGAMLGDMLPLNNNNLMLIFMDILFILSILLIIHVINIEINKDKNKNLVFNVRFYPWIITSIISVIILFTCAQLDTDSVEINNQVEENHEHHH